MAEEIEANTFQFFTRNPRGGRAREIGAEEVAAWEKERAARDIYPIMGHLPYTVNMASPKDEVYEFARLVLTEDLSRCEACGAELLVVHPGSHLGAGVEEGRKRIASLLEEILGPWGRTGETAAGDNGGPGDGSWDHRGPCLVGRSHRLAGKPGILPGQLPLVRGRLRFADRRASTALGRAGPEGGSNKSPCRPS